jgi:hypothetical protein
MHASKSLGLEETWVLNTSFPFPYRQRRNSKPPAPPAPTRFTVYLSTEPPPAIMDAINQLTPLESAAQLKRQSRVRHDSILVFDGL